MRKPKKLTATGSTATMNEAKRKHCTTVMLITPIAPDIAKPYRVAPEIGILHASLHLLAQHSPTNRKLSMLP